MTEFTKVNKAYVCAVPGTSRIGAVHVYGAQAITVEAVGPDFQVRIPEFMPNATGWTIELVGDVLEVRPPTGTRSESGGDISFDEAGGVHVKGDLVLGNKYVFGQGSSTPASRQFEPDYGKFAIVVAIPRNVPVEGGK